MTNTTNIADTAPVRQPAKRTRRNFGRVLPPTDRLPKVRHGMLDGSPVAYIELSGRHGQGREMVLYAADWSIAEAITPWWVVALDPAGNMFVASGRLRAARLAGQAPTAVPNLPLARVLTGAVQKGVIVWYRDRNPFNLRRSNLELLTRREKWLRIKGITSITDGPEADRATAEALAAGLSV